MTITTVNATLPRVEYTATSAQVDFVVPFEFFADADLKVYQVPDGVTPDDTTHLLTLTTHYTVTGAGVSDPGARKITLVSGATADDTIIIESDDEIDRDTAFLSTGDLTIAAMNLELNKLIMLNKQLSMLIENRQLAFQHSAILDGINLLLPQPAADSAFVWNAAADAVEFQDADTFYSGFANAAAAASAADSAASAAAALVSENNAATSETNAAASYDSFDDRYLGEKAVAPTLDNDGNALINGAMYWNNSTTPGKMWIYDTDAGSWGLITSAVATSASSISVSDAGGYYTGTEVETALQEVGLSFVEIEAQTAGLNIKIVEIGDWDMITSGSVNVAHGLTLSKIRSLSAIIRNDADTAYLDWEAQTHMYALSANVSMNRVNGGIFDTTDFDSTGYNRGWIIIHYTD